MARGRDEPLGPVLKNRRWEIREGSRTFSGVGSNAGTTNPRPCLRIGSLPHLRPILDMRVSNAAPPPTDLSGNCTFQLLPAFRQTNNYVILSDVLGTYLLRNEWQTFCPGELVIAVQSPSVGVQGPLREHTVRAPAKIRSLAFLPRWRSRHP